MTEATHKFFTRVDRRSKRAMAEFLDNHFRYWTMSSVNRVKSYANDVKITHVLPHAAMDKAFEVLETQEHADHISSLISDWDRQSNHAWQAGFNGRSGGYIVLYQGGAKPSEYKRRCLACGQKNYRAETTKCGRCHSDRMVDFVGTETFSWPGRGLDDDEDLQTFLDWDIASLRDRVELVQSFDKLCDDIVAEFLYLCDAYEVVDETVYVPKTYKVLQEAT